MQCAPPGGRAATPAGRAQESPRQYACSEPACKPPAADNPADASAEASASLQQSRRRCERQHSHPRLHCASVSHHEGVCRRGSCRHLLARCVKCDRESRAAHCPLAHWIVITIFCILQTIAPVAAIAPVGILPRASGEMSIRQLGRYSLTRVSSLWPIMNARSVTTATAEGFDQRDRIHMAELSFRGFHGVYPEVGVGSLRS